MRVLVTCMFLAGLFLGEGCVSSRSAVEQDGISVRQRPLGIIGEAEPVVILPEKLVFDARIDTGATTSSIDARDIKEFTRDGDKWVRFSMVNRKTEEKTDFERDIVRVASITQHGRPDIQRPVVKMMVSMGPVIMEREFSLADRSAFEYPVLIGRNVLNGQAIVDVARSHTLKPVLPHE